LTVGTQGRFELRAKQLVLTDFTVNTSKLHPHFDLTMGVRNALGYRYEDPIATYLPRMRQRTGVRSS